LQRKIHANPDHRRCRKHNTHMVALPTISSYKTGATYPIMLSATLHPSISANRR
jgi:hypothetical protein